MGKSQKKQQNAQSSNGTNGTRTKRKRKNSSSEITNGNTEMKCPPCKKQKIEKVDVPKKIESEKVDSTKKESKKKILKRILKDNEKKRSLKAICSKFNQEMQIEDREDQSVFF